MPRSENGRPRRFGLDRLRAVDERCDRYEREWRAAAATRIEDYLDGLEGEQRTATWLELVMLDQELRRGRGETPSLADYRRSCPDPKIWLDISTGDLLPADPTAPAAEDLTYAGCLADAIPAVGGPGRVDPPAGDGAATSVAPGEPEDPVGPPGTAVPTPGPRADEVDGLVLARPGTRFGDYELIDRLGAGGMGVVFRARQTSLNREVALKLIRAGDLADARQIRMFRAEAEAVAGLDHPRIVPVLDSGEHLGILYYSMKRIEGRELGRCHAAFRDRPAAIARLVVQIAEAIAHAHERGILHRDIKPSNILIDAKGEPHVIDFGLVKRLGAPSETTTAAPTGGTPGYMAPEQARNDRAALTTATDVYGLGSLLYSLLAGRPPFTGSSPLELMRQVIEEEPPRPSHWNPRVDPDLETICLKAMRKDHKGRYPSARELADDLDRWLTGRPILARPASPVERVVKWVRRRKLIAALSAAAVIGAVIGVSGLAWGWAMAAAARDRAVEDENDARHQAYASDLNLAERDWRDGNIAEAIRHLKETIPPAGKSDLRGFEWHYLDRLTRSQGRVLARHTDSVRAVACSRDGRLVASVGEDRTIKLWDAETSRLIRSTDVGVPLYAVALHPDSTRLATGGVDFAVTIWDVATGQVIRTSPGHTKQITELEYSPDGNTLASSSEDGTVRLWNGGDGSPIRTIADHPAGSSTKLAFSPDGKAFASSGGTESTIRVWDIAAAGPPRTIADDLPIPGEGPGGRRRGLYRYPKPVAFSRDGKILASAEDGTIRLRDAADGRLLQTVRDPHHRDAVIGLAFSPDGKRLASFPYAVRSVSLWDVATGDLVRTIKVPTPDIYDIAFTPDGVSVAVACGDSAVRILDVTQDQEARTLQEANAAADVAFAPDGSFLATAVEDGTVTIRDLTTGKVVRTLQRHAGAVGSVVIAPDGRRAASAGVDRTVRVWDLATGKELHPLRGHSGVVSSLAFSPDGKAIASASEDRTVKLWDPEAGRVIRSLEGPAFAILAVAFSADGKAVIAGDGDGFVTAWDAASGRRLRVTKSHAGSIMAIAASPDGRRLATGGGFDHTIRIQDLADGREFRVLAGHAGSPRGLAFSRDGARLASSGEDGTVRIWDPASGLGVLVLRGHSGPVWAVAFSPDGMRLASAGADQTVRIWEAERAPAEDPPGMAPGAPSAR